MNSLGVFCALTSFLNIWFGHVAVRFIEARTNNIKLPAGIFVLAGLILIYLAGAASNTLSSSIFGISGLITLWDSIELFRQEKRVIKGHAPANPGNPRHKKILLEYSDASQFNFLAREPRGFPYSQKELKTIQKGKP